MQIPPEADWKTLTVKTRAVAFHRSSMDPTVPRGSTLRGERMSGLWNCPSSLSCCDAAQMPVPDLDEVFLFLKLTLQCDLCPHLQLQATAQVSLYPHKCYTDGRKAAKSWLAFWAWFMPTLLTILHASIAAYSLALNLQEPDFYRKT